MASERQFGPNGASRDIDFGKLDFEGFLSPLVLDAYARYMNACRATPTGLRDSDNWQKGIPLPVYMKSGWRHFFDWWKTHRRECDCAHIIIDLCALLFNTSGYLHEYLKAHPEQLDQAIKAFAEERAAEIAARKRGPLEPGVYRGNPNPVTPGTVIPTSVR